MFLKFAKLVSNLLGRTRWTSALIVVLLVLATLGRATPLEPLPNFDVQALDGNTIHSGDWPLQGKWLVIYVEPRCQPCTSLLTRLSKQGLSEASRMDNAIIVGGEKAHRRSRCIAKAVPRFSKCAVVCGPVEECFRRFETARRAGNFWRAESQHSVDDGRHSSGCQAFANRAEYVVRAMTLRFGLLY